MEIVSRSFQYPTAHNGAKTISWSSVDDCDHQFVHGCKQLFTHVYNANKYLYYTLAIGLILLFSSLLNFFSCFVHPPFISHHFSLSSHISVHFSTLSPSIISRLRSSPSICSTVVIFNNFANCRAYSLPTSLMLKSASGFNCSIEVA